MYIAYVVSVSLVFRRGTNITIAIFSMICGSAVVGARAFDSAVGSCQFTPRSFHLVGHIMSDPLMPDPLILPR